MPSFIRIAAVALVAAPMLAQAQTVRSEKNMSLELANQIAAASVAACQANGYAVAATWWTAPAASAR